MPEAITLEGIVIRRIDSGESDRRLILFTEATGKVEAIAKGARKAGSRLAGMSEPLSRGLFTLAQGQRRSFVTSVQPLTSYPGIRSDYDRLTASLAVCEVLDWSMPPEAPAEEAFSAFQAFLSSLSDGGKTLPCLAWLLVRLMLVEGHLPAWKDCIDLGESPLEEVCWVSAQAGGRISAERQMQYRDAIPATPEAIIALDRLAGLGQPPPALRPGEEVLSILIRFWEAILDRQLKGLRAVSAELLANRPPAPEQRM